jgi:oxygen-independent coproporphyrinogen III oxidase
MAGIYIHIPFCRRICHYCDFYRTAAGMDADAYIDALEKEMELRAGYLRGETVETLYFGGGTPSVLNTGHLGRILHRISHFHTLEKDCEITLEANPDDLSDEYLRSLREGSPFNRLSIGVQSFHDRDLSLMNRRHTAQEAYQSIERAIGYGFSNISADLIYGIPGSSLADMNYNLDRLTGLDIQHLSAYHLTIEKGTVFFKKASKGFIQPVNEEESLSQFNHLTSRLKQKGFEHYEISNWAKDGFISRHNTNYWKGKPYLGLGPSSHSYDIVSRQWNVANLTQYLRALKDGTPFYEREVLTGTMRFNEHLLTSLRTMWGIDLKETGRAFGTVLRDTLLKKCEPFIRSGHMVRNGDTFTLTDRGYFISDAIVRDLMEEGRQ